MIDGVQSESMMVSQVDVQQLLASTGYYSLTSLCHCDRSSSLVSGMGGSDNGVSPRHLSNEPYQNATRSSVNDVLLCFF